MSIIIFVKLLTQGTRRRPLKEDIGNCDVFKIKFSRFLQNKVDF